MNRPGLGRRAAASKATGFVTRARRGQVAIMFALLLVPLVGMLGLAVDGGVYLYARRTAQATADAAALAGARQLSKGVAAQTDVELVANQNGQGAITPAVQVCRYVKANLDPIGSGTTCGDPPEDASGVFVRVEETAPTFFVRVIPGAPVSTVATASAIARVQAVTGLTADAPFIVCGYDSWKVSPSPEGSLDILTQDDPPTINPDAIGKTFRVWDPQLAKEGASCDEGSNFKGMAGDGNENTTMPGQLKYKSGTNVGNLSPMQSDVNGAAGCAAGTTEFDGCVLVLPLASNNSPEPLPKDTVWGVGFAAFKMKRVGTNSYDATLIGEYILGAPGDPDNPWTKANAGNGDIVSIRLAG